MMRRFWPVSIAGAIAVFLAGFMTALALGALYSGEPVQGLVFFLMVYLLLYHAADTARSKLLAGSYSRGWFGVRTGREDSETVVRAASEEVSK